MRFKRPGYALLPLLLLLFTVSAFADSGTFEKREDYDLASVRLVYSDGSYDFAEFSETASGYSWTAENPGKTYTATPEYFSTTVWDGAVDISWYNENDTEFYLSNPAQLAGLAALVNGMTDANTPDYRVKGDRSLLETKLNDSATLPGNVTGSVHEGLEKYNFADKTIYLTADMDMGGETDATNWMPIGGLLTANPFSDNYQQYMYSSWFGGVLDGGGHRITNLYCNRHVSDWSYGQGCGLIGCLDIYQNQKQPKTAPAVRNLSVSGYIYGNRMVGGIVGHMGDYAEKIYIENCANHCEILSSDSKGVGGIVGTAWGNDGAIINCYNDGSVTTTLAQTPGGGICGSNSGLDVICCYNVGTVSTAGGRGRGIGGHDSGSYIVDSCYYLEGCDDDPSSGGWYMGTAEADQVQVTCTALSSGVMQSRQLVNLLNVSGTAYVYVPGSYPVLYWEAAEMSTCSVTVQQASGGTITVDRDSVPAGTVVHLENTLETGWAFRSYSADGAELPHDYYTVTGDTVISGSFESMQAGVLKIPHNDACTISVTKTGTAMIDGVMVDVTDYPITNGSPIYENDVLTATAVWNEGTYPADPDLVYISMVNPVANNAFLFSYTYATAEEFESEDFEAADAVKTSHTVTADITGTDVSLYLTAVPQTTNKTWGQVADTSWYNDSDTEFTITTARQLAGLIRLVGTEKNALEGKTIKLGCDISLENDDGTEGIRWWEGIGSSTTYAFAGIFDGCGYKITDMTAKNTSSYVALFKYTSGADIRNLTVSGTASALGGSAGIVSQCAGTALTACRSFVTVSDTRSGYVGGIAAKLSGGCTLTECFNYSAVSGKDCVGGIVGDISDDDSVLIDCVNYGDVSGTSSVGSSGGIGGVAGRISKAGTLRQCANYGSLSGGSYYMGGVAGYAGGTTTVNCTLLDCCSYGVVNNVSTNASASTGGIAGYFNYATMTNCLAYGSVSCQTQQVGGVIGKHVKRSSATVTNCYYLDSAAEGASGGATLSGVQAVTASALASDADLLAALSADGAYVRTNGSYPELQIAAQSVHVHSGGTASCCVLAVCEDCGLSYGELNPDNHPDGALVLKNAKAAVWTQTGYTGDQVCSICGGTAVYGADIEPDTEKIVFTVYEQEGDAEPVLKKAFTAAEMDVLAQESNTGVQYYQYWSTGENERENVTAAVGYATMVSVLNAAGVSYGIGDIFRPDNGADVSYTEMAERCWYYSSRDERTTVPVVLTFCSNSVTFSASDNREEKIASAVSAAVLGDGLRLCYGVKESDYKNIGGFRMLSGIQSVTIIHRSGDVDGDGSITINDIFRLILNIHGISSIDEERLPMADVNQDGTVDAGDVEALTEKYRGISDETECDEAAEAEVSVTMQAAESAGTAGIADAAEDSGSVSGNAVITEEIVVVEDAGNADTTGNSDLAAATEEGNTETFSVSALSDSLLESITVSAPVSVDAGEEFTVTLCYDAEIAGLYTMETELYFDNKLFSLVKASCDAACMGVNAELASDSLSGTCLRINYVNSEGGSIPEGSTCTFTFTAKQAVSGPAFGAKLTQLGYTDGTSDAVADYPEDRSGEESPSVGVKDASLTLGGVLKVNFYCVVPDDGYVMINDARYETGDALKVGTEYRFSEALPLSIKDINAPLTVGVYQKDGTKVDEVTWSLSRYAAKVSEDNAALSSLIASLQTFGSCAAAYFGTGTQDAAAYDPDAAVPDNAFAEYAVVQSGTLPSEMSYYGSSLILKSTTTIRHYFKGDVTGKTFTFNGKEVKPEKKGDYWYIELTGIPAARLDTPYVCKVTDGENTWTISYSALSYGAAAVSSGKTTLRALVKALWSLSNAAGSYFGGM